MISHWPKLTAILIAVTCVTRAGAQLPAPGDHDHHLTGGRVLPLPRDLEMRLAVNALPKDLRAGATVLVMEPTGYVKAHQGTNTLHAS